LLVATEGYPGGNRAIIWDISPERLRTGMPAVEVVGHLDDEGHTDFERRAANDRATPKNIYPRDVVLDPIDHRLFAIDQYNNRVVVWQLDRQNRVKDRNARWVLGQPDLYSGELYPIGPTTIKIPLAVTYDVHHKRVFVSDGWGNRILVFDAHPDRMRNGPEAIAVLGQPNFTSITPATTAVGINLDTRVGTGITPTRPRGTGLAYDPVHDRLFVSDGGNHRVLGFDVAPNRLRSGMPASVVLGQPDFTTRGSNSTLTGLYQPAALLYESKQHRLFVADGNNNRVLVFDARPDALTNGAEPTVVIGQPDFNTFGAGRSQKIIDGPDGLAYDYVNDRLFLSDHGSDRILLFDAHPARLDNGPDAQHVIGQPDFDTRRLGPVRANELWDPRGLTFDSEHQRLYVSQGFASNIMIHDMARSTYESLLPAQGIQNYQSASADTELVTQRGWAVATGPSALGGGVLMLTHITTLFDELSQRESRVLISEAGLSAPPVTDRATVFTDGRAGRTTILSLSNPNSEPVTVSLVFRDADGSEVSDRIERQIASNGSTAWPLDELQASGPGSVELSANAPLALIPTR
jgi:DNA-binding beta-propeller fold protein YncE